MHSQKLKYKLSRLPKMTTLKIILLAVSICSILTACTKSKGTTPDGNSDNCSTTAKTFATDVKPIIEASCASAGCHGVGSTRGPGALTSYSQIFNARSVIRSSVSSGRMPLNSSLTIAQKNSIICWIDNGALDN